MYSIIFYAKKEKRGLDWLVGSVNVNKMSYVLPLFVFGSSVCTKKKDLSVVLEFKQTSLFQTVFNSIRLLDLIPIKRFILILYSKGQCKY